MTARPGFRVRVIVNCDFVLASYPPRGESGKMILKAASAPGDRSVKLSIELPVTLHRDLAANTEMLARGMGQIVEPAKLIPPTLTQFIVRGCGFARRAKARMVLWDSGEGVSRSAEDGPLWVRNRSVRGAADFLNWNGPRSSLQNKVIILFD